MDSRERAIEKVAKVVAAGQGYPNPNTIPWLSGRTNGEQVKFFKDAMRRAEEIERGR